MKFPFAQLFSVALSLSCFSPLATEAQDQSKTVLDQAAKRSPTVNTPSHRQPPIHHDSIESGQQQPRHYQMASPQHYHVGDGYNGSPCDCQNCVNRAHRIHDRVHSGQYSGRSKFWKTKTQLPVEEVRYGLNAGLPSFGVVSHGPWYNGPTRELLGAKRCIRLARKLLGKGGESCCTRCGLDSGCDCESYSPWLNEHDHNSHPPELMLEHSIGSPLSYPLGSEANESVGSKTPTVPGQEN